MSDMSNCATAGDSPRSFRLPVIDQSNRMVGNDVLVVRSEPKVAARYEYQSSIPIKLTFYDVNGALNHASFTLEELEEVIRFSKRAKITTKKMIDKLLKEQLNENKKR